MTGIPIERMETQEDKEVVLSEEWNYIQGGILGRVNPISDTDIRLRKLTLRSLLKEIGDVMLQIHPDWLLNIMFKDFYLLDTYIDNDKKYWTRTNNNLDMFNINGNKKIQEVHESVLTRQAFKYFSKSKWIITDLRKPNELQAIRDRNGICIKVIKEDDTNEDTHISETALDHITDWDYIISAKHGDIESLIRQVKKFLIKFEII
jgi:hypothetical protein